MVQVKTIPAARRLRKHVLRTNSLPLSARFVRRQRIQTKLHQELIADIRKQMGKVEFYSDWGKNGYGDRIKKYVFRGREVLLKYAADASSNLSDHGKNPELIRSAILAHQKAARSGEINSSKYLLVTPKLYGRIGDVIVFEHMGGELRGEKMNGAELKDYISARKQLEDNFWKLFEKGRLQKNGLGITPIPQTGTIMCLGKRGKRFVFGALYDVH